MSNLFTGVDDEYGNDIHKATQTLQLLLIYPTSAPNIEHHKMLCQLFDHMLNIYQMIL